MVNMASMISMTGIPNMKNHVTWIGAVLLLSLIGTVPLSAGQAANLTLESAAFRDGEAIPVVHSAYGDSVSPALTWSDVPAGTEQFALILDDPDAPMAEPFVHWVLYNIPGNARGLPEGLPTDASLQEPSLLAGTIQGLNGRRRTGYFGPRPPAGSGPHHYIFTLYALDADLDLQPGLNKAELLAAIEGHVIGEGKLVGLYEAQ